MPKLKLILLTFILFIPIIFAFLSDSVVFDISQKWYLPNGKELRGISATNTGESSVFFTKAIVSWNGNAKLKELRLGSVKMWSNDSNPQPSGILLSLNGTLASGESNEVWLKFDADATNNVKGLLFEFSDGSTISLKLLEGYVIGTMNYQIKDGDEVIATEYAKNSTIYLVPSGLVPANPSLLKEWSPYQGNITVDADAGENRCTSQTYNTKQYFYDENNDGKYSIEETQAYSTQTDQRGCYAFNIPEGNYDVYS